MPAAAALEPGAKLVGQLFNTIDSAFQPSQADNAVAPNFQLSFGTSLVDSPCPDVVLHQGVGAEIADYAGSGAGIIRTGDISKYCFYEHGDDTDPDIDFIAKNTAATACPNSEPSGAQTLNNPQFIWLAYGSCKTANGCPSAVSPAAKTLSRLSRTRNIGTYLSSILPASSSGELGRIVSALGSQNPSVASVGTREAGAIQALALCQSVGISLKTMRRSSFFRPE